MPASVDLPGYQTSLIDDEHPTAQATLYGPAVSEADCLVGDVYVTTKEAIVFLT